jgi:gamma-glutamyl-gamma-aminobutyrate hydrolase PuuD
VIGIVTLPTSSKLKENMGHLYEAYVPSSYKKWVEQTGPVVIPHFLPRGQLRELINQIDGILFPGGAPALIVNDKPTPFMKQWQFIYDLAYE